jgi:hypothetical protein
MIDELLFSGTKQPELKFDGLELTEDERKLANMIVANQGKNKGRLRAAKPKIEYEIYQHRGRDYRVSTYDTGRAAYLWRMVAFFISKNYQHHSMPIMADCDLPFRLDNDTWQAESRAMAKELDKLADKICNHCVPLRQQTGAMRWARALGGI